MKILDEGPDWILDKSSRKRSLSVSMREEMRGCHACDSGSERRKNRASLNASPIDGLQERAGPSRDISEMISRMD
jgi:hypothetical protein